MDDRSHMRNKSHVKKGRPGLARATWEREVSCRGEKGSEGQQHLE